MKLNKWKEINEVEYDKGFSDFFIESDITKQFLPEIKETEIINITQRVKNWLIQDDKDGIFEINFQDTEGDIDYTNTVLFSRSEIYIKTCANAWVIWRIAEAQNWPDIISVKIGTLNENIDEMYLNRDDFRLPNEIRGENYSNEE